MTITGFLTIPGIEGESTNEAHAGEIDVYSVTWQVGDDDDPSAGRSRRGAISWSTFDFAKSYDKSSPDLVDAATKGKTFDEIVFVVSVTVAGESTDYLTITLRNASVARYQLDTGENQLEETVSIKCDKLVIDFEEYDVSGASQGHHIVELSTN